MTTIAKPLTIAMSLAGAQALDEIAGLVRKIRQRTRHRDTPPHSPLLPEPAALARAALRELDVMIWRS
jgi:hypothetical protein